MYKYTIKLYVLVTYILQIRQLIHSIKKEDITLSYIYLYTIHSYRIISYLTLVRHEAL